MTAKPGSGDGKIVANNGQMARLWEVSAYSPLNIPSQQPLHAISAGSPLLQFGCFLAITGTDT